MSYAVGDRVVVHLELDQENKIATTLGTATCQGWHRVPEELCGPVPAASLRAQLDAGPGVWSYEFGFVRAEILEDVKAHGYSVVVESLETLRQKRGSFGAPRLGEARAAPFIDGRYQTAYGPMTPDDVQAWVKGRGFDPRTATQPAICAAPKDPA